MSVVDRVNVATRGWHRRAITDDVDVAVICNGFEDALTHRLLPGGSRHGLDHLACHTYIMLLYAKVLRKLVAGLM